MLLASSTLGPFGAGAPAAIEMVESMLSTSKLT
jgi:hypothetical protein